MHHGFLRYTLLLLLPLVWAQSQPTLISLSSRQVERRVGVTSRKLWNRAASASAIPLKDYFNRTELQWYGEVQVGTPPQPFTVVFDTGSDLFEIPGKNCTKDCTNQRKFDWDKSSTYKFTDNGDGMFIQFATGVGIDPVNKTDPDWIMTMWESSDTVTIAGLTVPNVTFYLIDTQSPAFSPDPFDGIMGLMSNPASVMSGLLAQGLPSLFSLHLTPHDVGGAELLLGGIDETKFTAPLLYTPVISTSGFWELSIAKIAVNGQSNPGLSLAQDVIFDSGTSNMVFPIELAEAIYALISPDIKPNPAVPNTYGIPCAKVDGLPASIDFTFNTREGTPFNLTLPSNDFSLGPFKGDASLCQTVINVFDFDFQPVIGGSLLKHYYSTWDSGNLRMGFAKSSNATTTEVTTGSSGNGKNAAVMGVSGFVGAWKYLGVVLLGFTLLAI